MSHQPLFEVSTLPDEANGLELPEMLDVSGRRVCMIIPQIGFQDEELFQVRTKLEASGVDVHIASSSSTSATGMFGSDITPEMLLDFVNPDDFDAIVLVGGFGIDHYFKHTRLFEMVQRACQLDKVVAALSTASSILSLAGVLKGRKATTWVGPTNDKYRQILRLGGSKFTGESVEIDWPVITSADSESIEEFTEVLMEALSELIRLEEEEEAEAKAEAEAAKAEQQEIIMPEPKPRFEVIETGPGFALPQTRDNPVAQASNAPTPSFNEPVQPDQPATPEATFTVVEPAHSANEPAFQQTSDTIFPQPPTRVESVLAAPHSPWARPAARTPTRVNRQPVHRIPRPPATPSPAVPQPRTPQAQRSVPDRPKAQKRPRAKKILKSGNRKTRSRGGDIPGPFI